MSRIGRYVKATAKPGSADALVSELLEVAKGLRDAPGCELYLINRSLREPDVIWVTELWQSQEHLDAALGSESARARTPEVLKLVQDGGFERLDVEPLGGAGLLGQETGFAIVNLEELEDMAPRFGLGDNGEARFARTPLGAVGVGVSLQRLRPGARQAFGHHHCCDEEVYVVLGGAGLVAVDDTIEEIRRWDAIRVAPGSTRAFEAGPEGLEVLATGTHHAGDAQLRPGFWPA